MVAQTTLGHVTIERRSRAANAAKFATGPLALERGLEPATFIRVRLEDDHLLLEHPTRRFPLAGARVQFAPWCRRGGGRIGSAILLENGAARLCVGSRGARIDAHRETGAPVRRVDAEVDGDVFYDVARALCEHLARGTPFRQADMLPGGPRSGAAAEIEPPMFRSALATDRRRTVVWCAGVLGLLGMGGSLAVSTPSRDTKARDTKAQLQATPVVFKPAPPAPPAPALSCTGPHSTFCRDCGPGGKPACCGGTGEPHCAPPIELRPYACGHPGEPKCCGDRGAPPCKDPANWWRRNPEVPGY